MEEIGLFTGCIRFPEDGIRVTCSRFCPQFRQHFIFIKPSPDIDFGFPFPNIFGVIFLLRVIVTASALDRTLSMEPRPRRGRASLPMSGSRLQIVGYSLAVRCNLRRNTPSFPVSSRGDAIRFDCSVDERTAAWRGVRIDPQMTGPG
jgi:hypothetical protein